MGRRCQVQTSHAAIPGVVPALDEPARLEAVDKPRDRNGFHFDEPGQFVLGHAGAKVEIDENDPLSARHAIGGGALIRAHAHMPRHIVQQEQKVGFTRGGHNITIRRL